MLSVHCIFTLMHHKVGLKCTNFAKAGTTSFLVISAVQPQTNTSSTLKIQNCSPAGTVLGFNTTILSSRNMSKKGQRVHPRRASLENAFRQS